MKQKVTLQIKKKKKTVFKMYYQSRILNEKMILTPKSKLKNRIHVSITLNLCTPFLPYYAGEEENHKLESKQVLRTFMSIKNKHMYEE